VDAGRELFPDHVLDRGSHARGEPGGIGHATRFFAVAQQPQEILGTRQAADVGGADLRRHYFPRTLAQSVILPLKSPHAGYFMNSLGVQVQNCDTFGYVLTGAFTNAFPARSTLRTYCGCTTFWN